MIVDKDEAVARRLCDALAAENHRCELVVCDLVEPGACARAVEQATEVAGAPYGLVNNAGLNDGVALESGKADAFVLSLQRNVVHYFTMAQAALPALKQAQGAIVNIASKVALTGQGGTSGYAASKAAVLNLTRSMALDHAKEGIRVNAVCPGSVDTEMIHTAWQQFGDVEEAKRLWAEKHPLGRIASADEIGRAILFLASQEASFITGAALPVDGGITAG